MKKKTPVQLKIVPDNEPNAIGEWISVPEEIPVPYEGDGWKDMIRAYSKFVPEGYHIVMFKHSKVELG